MRLNPSLWSLGPILVELAKITQRMQHSVIKIIKRETNKIADKLTEKATQAECNTVIKIKRETNKNADKVTKEARQAKRTLGPLVSILHFRTSNGKCPCSSPSLNSVYSNKYLLPFQKKEKKLVVDPTNCQ